MQLLQYVLVHFSRQNWQQGEFGDCPQDWEHELWQYAQQSSQPHGALFAGYKPCNPPITRAPSYWRVFLYSELSAANSGKRIFAYLPSEPRG
jgi:hypothetical protein